MYNFRANPPESDLKFQVGGVRQLNLRLRLRRENGLDIGVAEISLIFRCSAAVVSLLFPLSFARNRYISVSYHAYYGTAVGLASNVQSRRQSGLRLPGPARLL